MRRLQRLNQTFLVAALIVGSSQGKALEFVNFDFDQNEVAISDNTALASQYQNKGVLFSGLIFTNFEDAYVSPFNTATFLNPTQPNDSVTAYAWFTAPGSLQAATTDFVSLTPTDASTLSLFTLTAYGLNGQVLATVQTTVEPTGQYLATEDPVISISTPGIRYISFSGQRLLQGEFALAFDNMSFNTTSPVPEPSSYLLFSTGIVGLFIRLKRRIDA